MIVTISALLFLLSGCVGLTGIGMTYLSVRGYYPRRWYLIQLAWSVSGIAIGVTWLL